MAHPHHTSMQLPPRGLSFQRPAEYDPTLLQRSSQLSHNSSYTSRQVSMNKQSSASLANDLGLDEADEYSDVDVVATSDTDDNENDDPNYSRHSVSYRTTAGFQPSKQRSSLIDLQPHLGHEVETLRQQLEQLHQQRATYESQLKTSNERIDELKRMAAHSKQILITKFKAQIAALMHQVDEQKQQLMEDEQQISELRIGSGVAADDEQRNNTDAELRHTKAKLRDAETEIVMLRSSAQELESELQQQQQQGSSGQPAAASPSRRASVIPPASAVNTEQQKHYEQQIAELQSQRSTLQQQCQTLQEEVTATTQQIQQLQQQTKTQAAANTAATAQADTERQQLQQQISHLQQQLQEQSSKQAQPTIVSTPPPQVDTAALDESRKRVAQLEAAISKLDELLKQKDAEVAQAQSEAVAIKDKAQEKLTMASDNIKKLKQEYSNLRDAYKQQQQEHSTLQSEFAVYKETVGVSGDEQKSELARLHKLTKQLQTQHKELRQTVGGSYIDVIHTIRPLLDSTLRTLTLKMQTQLTSLQQSLVKEQAVRRRVFNQLQELRGNIRVYCRVRPAPTRAGVVDESDSVVTYPQDQEISMYNREKDVSTVFEYDKVFKPDATQTEVFQEVSDLVTSVLDGYNVCIFAYGQTGSGKTFTMQGPADNPGVNTRALSKLFNDIQTERSESWSYTIQLSLLEIYNDAIQDLLGDNREPLKARENQKGEIEVPGLTRVQVTSSAEVLEQLRLGSKNRNVRQTAMNDLSSRSHLILSVYISGSNKLTNKEVSSKLHLIDLAGSERVGRSGVTGDALKEAQNINSSLSALGNVINARASKQQHAPYRDSSLTWLLKDSLEKNSKTLMVVQISPVATDVSESISSLKFAARAREVELGKATVNAKKAVPKK